MCFSAEASFAAAAITGAVGAVCLPRAQRRGDLPLAAVPALFAGQQAIEGAVWLELAAAPHAPISGGLTLAYLVFAQAFWPAFTPLAAWLAEPRPSRRRLMIPWLALGMAVSAHLLAGLLSGPSNASAASGHIAYATPTPYSHGLAAAYVAATTLPLLIASQRAMQALGLIVLVGCAVAYAFYQGAVLSVWCFFAAAASAVILLHFERLRRTRTAEA